MLAKRSLLLTVLGPRTRIPAYERAPSLLRKQIGKNSEYVSSSGSDGGRADRRFAIQRRFCDWARPSPAVPSRIMRAQIDSVASATHRSARYHPDAGSTHTLEQNSAIVPRL